MITIIRAGLQATVQDLGRPHYGHLGVPAAGAADPWSLQLANRLVGNDPADAGIEFLLGRFQIRFETAARFALTGAPVDALLDADPVDFGVRAYARSGQVLRTRAPLAGLRTYLAVGGGIDVPAVLGSRSTDTLSGLGPPALKDGSTLAINAARSRGHGVDFTVQRTVCSGHPLDIGIRLGPRDDLFSSSAINNLTTENWTVTTDVDRIGARLQGPPLTPSCDGSALATEGLALGSVQVPPSGAPIVHLANHPPTGGYPVIAVVDRFDVARIAQARPGTMLRFHLLARAEYPRYPTDDSTSQAGDPA